MKKTFTLIGIMLLSAVGFSQANVANPSFEDWSDLVVFDSLEHWRTSTQQYQFAGIPVDNAHQIQPGYAGANAMHLETELWYNEGSGQNDTLFGYIIKEDAGGPSFDGFPYSDTVNSFTGWFKCDVVAGDTAMAIVELSKGGVIYSTAVYKFIGAQATWTQFTLSLPGGETEEPDSVFVGFASSDPFNPGVAEPGSWLEVDDISFEFTSGSMTTPSAIPNQSFEDLYQETIETADEWWSFDPLFYNQAGSVYVTKSTDAAVGSFSMQIETTFDNVLNNIPSLVTNGYFDIGSSAAAGGVPFIAQPDSLTFQFKYAPSLTDTAFFMIEMWNAGSGMLLSVFDTIPSAAVWTTRTFDLGLTEAPDSMRILFYSGDNLGSVLMVDDIQFIGGDVSIEEPVAELDWNYFPNPTNDLVTITFDESSEIEIIDITGKTIYINNSLNSNSISVSTLDWNNGVYFIRMNNNGYIETKKLIVRH